MPTKFLRKTHGFLGLTFGLFLLIQGVTAVIIGFEKPLEKYLGKSNLKVVENIHKGKVFGVFKDPYRVLVGLSLCYLSVTGLAIGLKSLRPNKAIR
jgi:uncharacterized iron-regulated membrane protein